jgi:hypothetical protein
METQIKIKKVNKASNFLQVTAELDGEIYEGVLMSKGGEKDEKRTQSLASG